MSEQTLHRTIVHLLLSHPNSYKPRNGYGEVIAGEVQLDMCFLPDRRRVWARYVGEGVLQSAKKNPDGTPLLAVGNVSIEDDSTTTMYALALDGRVVMTKHESERHSYTVGQIIEGPRELEPEEVISLQGLIVEAK